MASPPLKRRRTRSALSVYTDEDTNNPTTVHDHDTSSDFSQGKLSKPELLNKIAHEGNHEALLIIRAIFAQRYSGVNIYVDKKSEPSKFLIHKWHGMDSAQEYKVYEDDDLKIITSEMEKKWPSPVPSYEKNLESYKEEKFDCLQYMWHVFQTVAERIIYDWKESQWISNADAVLGSSGATAADEESDQSHLPENKKESDTSQEEKCHLDKPENQQKDEARKKDLLRATLAKYDLLSYKITARMINALKSQMRNSCGRDTVSILLRCACAIAFGPHYEENGVYIYQVGTSNYPFEGFPVSSMDEYQTPNDKPEDVESPVPKATMPLSLELPGYHSPPANVSCKTSEPNVNVTSPSSVSSGQESTKSFGKGYIYPDLIVACESGDNAKFLLLVEVKSNTCLNQNKAQVLRQGVGALVGQKQVFALIVSQMSGSLLKICRDDDHAEITYDAKQYRLLGKKRDGQRQFFNSEAWFMMFMDMIKVLDSAKENIVLG